MSWIKENYEKAALGGAAAVLVGVVATSYLGGGEKPSAKALKFDRDDDPATEALIKMASVLADREVPAVVRPKSVGNREVGLFVGQSLYLKEGSTSPVDLHESGNAHEGIANEFWLKYGIDPSFANAPERDFDKDGFTNMEEYTAQTNPADVTSYPSLVAKLVGNGVDVFKMQMRWSTFDAQSVTLYYQDNKRLKFNERVNLGGKFFSRPDAPVTQRFVLGAASKQQDSRARMQDAYEVTDTTPRYKGTEKEKFHLLRRGPKNGGFNEIQDRSVTLTLHALGAENQSFTIGEYESFSLPYDANAKKRPYKVTKIEPIADQADTFSVEIVSKDDSATPPVTLTVRKN